MLGRETSGIPEKSWFWSVF